MVLDETGGIMNIRHEEYGLVEGVKLAGLYSNAWHRRNNGRVEYFYESEGWAEVVPEKQWVEVPPDWLAKIICEKYCYNPDQRLKCVERYDLPDEWYEEWCSLGISMQRFLERYKKPCLIVEEYR